MKAKLIKRLLAECREVISTGKHLSASASEIFRDEFGVRRTVMVSIASLDGKTWLSQIQSR